MNNEDNLDLLDLEDETQADDALPEVAPLAAPRPRKPWLLLGVGVLVVILATYIIVRVVGGDSSSSIEVDLDAPVVTTGGGDVLNVPNARGVPDVKPVPVPVAPAPMPEAKPQPAAPVPVAQPAPEPIGVPVRVIEDRKPVTFNPNKQAQKPQAKPQPAPKAVEKKVAQKQQSASNGGWYVQFGSYSTRALAESAQRKITSQHSGLFAGKQFVILAAVLPNGTTTYRLRIAFASSKDANGFCQNAKSDGVDCYVAK